MTVRERLLKILETNQEKNLSGQSLADELGVSRTAVWKAMKELKAQGYVIEAVNNKGYTLKNTTDVLSIDSIAKRSTSKVKKENIQIYPVLDSTNLEMKRQALSGAPEHTVIIAEHQTAGKGRMGRPFYSPSEAGIYMSLLLKPTLAVEDSMMITTVAAVAVARSIRTVLKIPATIKWVNDIYLGEQKVCGILTEGMTDFETGNIENIILGIGINYRMPREGYPDEIKERAGALEAKEDIPRNELIATILNEFYNIYEHLPDRSFLEDYRRWFYLADAEIRYLEGEKWFFGKAVGIDDNGGLIVEENGVKKVLRTGEVTVRKA